MLRSGFIVGYHGCSTRVAVDILRHRMKHLPIRHSANEWLGDGVYFWENSFSRAMQWAEEHIKAGERPAVLAALISPGNCLDLSDSKSVLELQSVVTLFEASYALDHPGKQLPNNSATRHTYDCALVNYYHRVSEQPKNTVRSPFIEGEPIGSNGCSFHTKNHIQWAVRTPQESILGYFTPRQHAQPLLDAELKR